MQTQQRVCILYNQIVTPKCNYFNLGIKALQFDSFLICNICFSQRVKLLKTNTKIFGVKYTFVELLLLIFCCCFCYFLLLLLLLLLFLQNIFKVGCGWVVCSQGRSKATPDLMVLLCVRVCVCVCECVLKIKGENKTFLIITRPFFLLEFKS